MTDPAAEPLSFAFWTVAPAIVSDNLRRYAAETGEAVRPRPVTGRYGATVGAELAAGRGPDVFYAQRAEAALWAARGLIAPLDETAPVLAPTLSRMDPRYVAGARDARGRLLGTTYYNAGPFALFARPGGPEEGFAGWDEALDFLRRAKRDGPDPHPFQPRWHATQTGLVWTLLSHAATEGAADLDDDAAPGALARAVAFLRAVAREGIAPPEALDDADDAPALRRWAAGRGLLTFTMDYLAADAAALAGRPVSRPLPPPGPGDPVAPGHALICLRAGLAPGRGARALRLAAAMGGVDASGAPRVHRRWLAERLFPVPFPELDADPALRASLERFFPAGEARACVDRLLAARARTAPSPVTRRPWALAWTAAADRLLRADLRRPDGAPETVAERLLDLWRGAEAAHRPA